MSVYGKRIKTQLRTTTVSLALCLDPFPGALPPPPEPSSIVEQEPSTRSALMILAIAVLVAAMAAGNSVSAAKQTIPAFAPGLTEYQGRVAVGKEGFPSDSVSWDWLGSQVSVTLDHSSYLTVKVATANSKLARLRCFASFSGTLGTPTLYPLSEIVLLPSIDEYAVGAWPSSTGGWNGSTIGTQVTVTIMNDQE